VVGEYQTPDGKFHGFCWERGRFATIDMPGAPLTSLIDINNRGQIVGFTLTGVPVEQLRGARGFVLRRGVNGRFTPIDVPGAPTPSNAPHTKSCANAVAQAEVSRSGNLACSSSHSRAGAAKRSKRYRSPMATTTSSCLATGSIHTRTSSRGWRASGR
jgi:hypothetical protein